uniref:NPH3 domain-containing protein n=1 Tax=Angiostrongylus cantonensis TaxID=6313 RepID=A0A0K0D763_ANGCA
MAISAIDRMMLPVDAFGFSKSSKLGIEVYLNLLLYVTEKMDHLSWLIIDEQMRIVERLVEKTPVEESFKCGRFRPTPELFRVVLNEDICQGDRDAWDSIYEAYPGCRKSNGEEESTRTHGIYNANNTRLSVSHFEHHTHLRFL